MSFYPSSYPAANAMWWNNGSNNIITPICLQDLRLHITMLHCLQLVENALKFH